MKKLFCLLVTSLLSIFSQAQDNALDFDGIDDYVYFSPNNVFQLSGGTMECWVKPRSFVQNQVTTLFSNRGSGGTRYSFHIGESTIGLWNGTNYFPLTYNFTAGQWYHLAFVYDASANKVEYYVNGVSLGFGQTQYGYNENVTGQPFIMGAVKEGANPQELYTGALDELRIWSTLRTATEIQKNKDITMTGSESGLVALYSFNQAFAGTDNTGQTTLLDKTQNGNNGTLNNFTLKGNSSNFISGFSEMNGTTSWMLNGNAGLNPLVNAIGTTDDQRLAFKTNNAEKMTLLSNGNMGIGTSAPLAALDVRGNIFTNGKLAIGTTDTNKINTYSLAVNGDAIFQKVKVKLYSVWPDFVFKKDYILLPLKDVESYIKKNNHLPGIPAAEEMRKQDLDIGDNQALLLKKIEELTLYLIEQNKILEKQRRRIQLLEKNSRK